MTQEDDGVRSARGVAGSMYTGPREMRDVDPWAKLRYGAGRGYPEHPGARAGHRLPGVADGRHRLRFHAGRPDGACCVDRRKFDQLGQLGHDDDRGGQRLGRW